MTATSHWVQAMKMVQIMRNTIPFMVKHAIWKGMFRQKLILAFSLLSAMVIPYSMYRFLAGHFQQQQAQGLMSMGEATVSAASQLSAENLYEGGNIYLAVILLQMVVVYFSNKTIEHLSGMAIDMSVRDLIASQVRTIVVSVRNWVFQLVIGIVISIVIGIFGPDFLEEPLKWLVQCYFVGYLFIDNYNFTFGLSSKESHQIVQRHGAATFVVGLVANVLFFIPVVGFILASFICSVAATYYMHTSADAQGMTTATGAPVPHFTTED